MTKYGQSSHLSTILRLPSYAIFSTRTPRFSVSWSKPWFICNVPIHPHLVPLVPCAVPDRLHDWHVSGKPLSTELVFALSSSLWLSCHQGPPIHPKSGSKSTVFRRMVLRSTCCRWHLLLLTWSSDVKSSYLVRAKLRSSSLVVVIERVHLHSCVLDDIKYIWRLPTIYVLWHLA